MAILNCSYWRRKILQAYRIYNILSVNASDLFLALLTESGCVCLAFSYKIYRNYSWVFERQKLCLFSVVTFLFRNVQIVKKEVSYCFSCAVYVHLTHSGHPGLGVFPLFTENWWKQCCPLPHGEHALVAEQNLCDLNSSFEICLENLLEFLSRMNKKAASF